MEDLLTVEFVNRWEPQVSPAGDPGDTAWSVLVQTAGEPGSKSTKEQEISVVGDQGNSL